jgi:hypothetical protein
MNILDQYVRSEPSAQEAVNIFRGEWSSMLPPESGLEAGRATLFEDQRIVWAEQQLGSFEGYKIIELGPLEAGHTYMLEKRGAASILAVEANTRAYLKCLIVKEVLGLRRCRFLLGDFVEHLRANDERYDLCLASGVLYHMANPAELIHLISETSDRVLLWSHYYHRETIRGNPDLSKRFPEAVRAEYKGFVHTLHRYEYLEALNWGGFCGGNAPHSFWMAKEELLSCMRYFGFNDLRIEFDTLDHPNGPAFCILGVKSPAP